MSIISVPVAIHFRENECTLCGWEWDTAEADALSHCPECDDNPSGPTVTNVEEHKQKTPST